MPRKYKRKEVVRARVCSWTTEQLQSAFEEMDRKTMGINEISRQFGIPSRTLRRRYAAKNTTKQTLGKHTVLILDGISIVDIGDSTIAEILGSDIEPETPSKLLIEASPIPKIPLTMSKRAKQSADILNSEENIKQKNDMAERKEKQIKTKLHKKNNTETTKEKRELKKKKTTTSKKERQLKKQRYYISDNDDDDLAELCDKENDNYLKVNQGRDQLKRRIIYSSNCEDEEYSPHYKIKGKKTKGLPVKRSKKDVQDKPKDTNKDTCVECFEDYKTTKSQSDWIQCVKCQSWLHETCTLFRNYCTRCGKLKALSG